MNRKDLAAHLAAETDLTAAAADRMVAAVLSAMADELARAEPVAIAGFGKFTVRSHAARTGCNPQTGEPVAIVAYRAPSFKPAQALRQAVNE